MLVANTVRDNRGHPANKNPHNKPVPNTSDTNRPVAVRGRRRRAVLWNGSEQGRQERRGKPLLKQALQGGRNDARKERETKQHLQ